VIEYLRLHQGAKLNIYVPGDDTKKPLTRAERKRVALEEAEKRRKRNLGAASVEDLFGFNPFKKDAENYDESQIPAKWRKYYKMLIELRDKHQHGLTQHADEALKKSDKNNAPETSSGYGQHLADAGSESFERDFALSLVSDEQAVLSEINAAIDRMKRGTYGVCEQTGKPIPVTRLAVIPWARYTLEGQLEVERNRRLRSKTLGGSATEIGERSAIAVGGVGETSEDN
jgi:RNA polymerase-binding transcription factor DksA